MRVATEETWKKAGRKKKAGFSGDGGTMALAG